MAYLDVKDRGGNRESWKYTYTGAQLHPYAEAKLLKVQQTKKEARARIDELLQAGVDPRSDDAVRAAANFAAAATEEEHLQVFLHEFSRCRLREYFLAASDVVYFYLPFADYAPLPAMRDDA